MLLHRCCTTGGWIGDNVVGIMSRRRAWRFRVRILVGVRYVPLLQNVQTGPGATQPPVQWVSGFFPRVKWPGRDVDSSPPYRVLIGNDRRYTSTPPHMGLEGADSTFSRHVSSGLIFFFSAVFHVVWKLMGLILSVFATFFFCYSLSSLVCLFVLSVEINKAARLSCLTLVLWYVLIGCLRSCICRYDKGHASVQILPSYVNYKSFFCSCLRPSVYLRIRRSTFYYRLSTGDILRSWRHCRAF